MRKNLFFVSASLLTLLLFLFDISAGSSGIGVREVARMLFGGEVTEEERVIILEIRVMRALTALLAGIAVAVSGLLMQTLFRNPLAGPHLLGVNSGASLGAALWVLGAPLATAFSSTSGNTTSALATFLPNLGLAGSAWIGALAVLVLVWFVSRKLDDIMTVLILGMMLSCAVDSAVQILQYLGDGTSLKSYVLWTMGSLGSVSSARLPLLLMSVTAGLAIAAASVKSLNMLLLGEEYAVSMGLSVRKTRFLIYLSVALLTGTVTAFCGPVGFIGLASPHIARIFLRDGDHACLMPASALCGAVVLLSCDILSRHFCLPVNVLTSLFGVPVVVMTVLRQRGKNR